MTPKSSRAPLQCDHAPKHIVPRASPYIVTDDGRILCAAHAADEGIMIEWPDTGDESAAMGSWE